MEITGPAGIIEAQFQPRAHAGAATAVLCHPHPLYGGSMHDAVLGCAADVLHQAGLGVLRFNFRGVGRSAGRFDSGQGETEDLVAAAAWVRETHPGPLWLCGYSFGAYVVWRALGAGLAAERAVLLAPPVGRMEFAPLSRRGVVDVIAGDDDDFIDPAALTTWQGVSLHRIRGADHFFNGCFGELTQRVRDIVARPSDDANA
jgi:uncharacterized protein